MSISLHWVNLILQSMKKTGYRSKFQVGFKRIHRYLYPEARAQDRK
jgi:hypothetical protein